MKRLRACTTWSNLPIDLIFSILVKLPAKCLLRFRCVCKEWRNLIHTSYFISMHNIAHENDNYYVIHNNARCRNSLKKEFFQWNKNCSSRTIDGSYDLNLSLELDFSEKCPPGLPSYFFDFFGSCNGLVCLSILPYIITSPSLYDDHIFLWNPSINKLKALHYHERFPNICSIGFGRCKGVADDCKVVILSYDNDDVCKSTAVLLVYTLSTFSWKRIDTNVCINIDGNWNSSKSVNGALHWVGRKPNQENVILSFDLQTEVLREIMLPKTVDGELMYQGGWYLENFHGALSLISFNSDKIFVWVMKEYGAVESWTKHVIDFDAEGYDLIHFGKEGCMIYKCTNVIFMVAVDNDLLRIENNVADDPNHESYCRYCAIDYNESLLLLNETL